jgi:hypothetical protein
MGTLMALRLQRYDAAIDRAGDHALGFIELPLAFGTGGRIDDKRTLFLQ